MTKLVELKLQTIQYHNGDNMDYLMTSMAKDACYTSYNSLVYKKKQMDDTITDFETAVTEGRDMKAEAITRKLDNMEIELEHLEERHNADCQVYTIITDGQAWTPERKKRKVTSALAKKVAELKKRVA